MAKVGEIRKALEVVKSRSDGNYLTVGDFRKALQAMVDPDPKPAGKQ